MRRRVLENIFFVAGLGKLANAGKRKNMKRKEKKKD
jgi:hypothetical protein